jgi:hypothetical protein
MRSYAFIRHHHFIATLLACALASGCSSAPNDVLDAAETLRALESIQLQPAPAELARVSTTSVTFAPDDGLNVLEASALAIHLHPRLRAVRADRRGAGGARRRRPLA